MVQVTGGDQFGTAAGNGSTGALAHDGGRQGNEETVGGGADLVDEGKVGSQSFRFLAQETYQKDATDRCPGRLAHDPHGLGAPLPMQSEQVTLSRHVEAFGRSGGGIPRGRYCLGSPCWADRLYPARTGEAEG